MSSIGSGKTPTDALQEYIYDTLVQNAAAAAGGADDASSDKGKASAGGKAQTKGGKGVHLGTGATDKGSSGVGTGTGTDIPAKFSGSTALASDVGAQSLRQVTDPAVSSRLPTTEPAGTDGVHSYAVSTLAQDSSQPQALQQITEALTTLQQSPTADDATYKQALTDLASGMEALGRGSQINAALNGILAGTSTSDTDLSHKEELAQEAGLDLTPPTGTDAQTALSSAQALLQADLSTDTPDASLVYADTAAVKGALTATGQADEAGTTLASILSSSGTSASGMGACLAAAAGLGITLPDSQAGAAEDAASNAKMMAVQRKQQEAAAQAAQQKAAAAAAAAAAQQQAASGGSGGGGSSNGASYSSGGGSTDMTGALGDISNLTGKSGAVTGNFKMGVLPDYDNGSTGGASGFIKRTGVTPAEIGGYVNANADGSFDLAAAERWIKDAKQNGVPTVSLAISAYGTGKLSDTQVQGIQTAVSEARANGLEVDIRFGYEMNYGGGGGEQGGRVNNNNDNSAFQTQWAQVAAVVNPYRDASPPAKMIWSPNVFSGGDKSYDYWLPADPSTIDQVALDYYHSAGSSVSASSLESVMDPIYSIAQKLNVPFIFGETGVTGASGNDGNEKQAWLNLLSSSEIRDKYPLYQGFYWFDYNKGGSNFSLSQDSSISSSVSSWYNNTFTSSTSST